MSLRDNGATVIFSTHNMSSVEELCDSITLINKSRNILSGSVEEVKQRYSDGNYRLTFNGDAGQLATAIEPFVNAWHGTDHDGELILSLKDNDARRPLIAAANDAVDLLGFESILPSMDNIFIQAVNSYKEPENA